jgi:hypothetical protein
VLASDTGDSGPIRPGIASCACLRIRQHEAGTADCARLSDVGCARHCPPQDPTRRGGRKEGGREEGRKGGREGGREGGPNKGGLVGSLSLSGPVES